MEQFSENELKAIVSVLATIQGLNPLAKLAVDALVAKGNLILSFHTPVEHVDPRPGTAAV